MYCRRQGAQPLAPEMALEVYRDVTMNALPPLRSRVNARRFSVPIRHRQWLAAVRIRHHALRGIIRPMRRPHADGEGSLHLVHPRLNLVLLDGLPNRCRPVLVELMRILEEQRLVRVDGEVRAALRPDGQSHLFSVTRKKRD